MQIPASYYYSEEHLWTKPDSDGLWIAGITDYAQLDPIFIIWLDMGLTGAAQASPEEINDAPYDTWLFKFKPSDEQAAAAQLMDEKAYAEYLGTL